ncbi:MAG: tetratricopeptide repeat protein [Gammaproteobacteria bacterium]|nr:tetratricopeptide repeat protein [Gammaproteobacteria bacterium]
MKNRPGTDNGTNSSWNFEPPSATAMSGESPEALLSRAAGLHQSGQLDLAEPLYRELLGLQPGNGDALHLLGVLRYQQRDPAAAVQLIEAALKIIPDNIHARTGLGLALLRLNRHEAALDSFDRALAIKPDFADALTRRGDALLGLGRQADALASYNRSLRYRPDDPETLNNRAAILIELGRLTEAMSSLDQALALAPGYLEALNNRATALIARKRHAEALSCCDQALAIQPEAAEVLNNRGVALRNLNRKDEAIIAFRAALAGQPDSADFHANLGATLLETGQLEEAEEHLRTALAGRKVALAFQNLAAVLYQRKKFSEALDIYRQWREFEPDNPIPQHMVAAGSDMAPERAGDRYIADLFDNFADTFDTTLLGLGYRVPELLTAQIGTARGSDTTPLRILDAGCGTGLAAPLLKPLARRLVGVDLSSAMLDKARERKLYDELVVGELCAFMASRPAAFDLIILADTLVYFGALEEAFSTAHTALAPGGMLAFAVESRSDGPDYQLELHGRYSHRPDYVTRLLADSGYTLQSLEPIVIRRELNADVAGIAVVARRKPA